jgi:3-oxoacyl-[acyl-carrier-protein] synthase-1
MRELEHSPHARSFDFGFSRIFPQGRVAFLHAGLAAKHALHSGRHDYILILAAASSLQTQKMNYYRSQRRLLLMDNPDGFIPGEAAVAVLISADQALSGTEILGLSMDHEQGLISGDKPVTGEGLTKAVNAVAEKSGIPISETAFRIATASGESYFFRELTIVHGRTMDNPRQDHPLWHPADSIGETGPASAAAMLVMAHYAFEKGYAPGDLALCLVSNDDSQRGAFILRKGGVEHG